MTQEYLIGELSVRLGQLQAAAHHAAAVDVADLRHQVETRSATWLAAETTQALALADQLCWDSLSHGDTAAFSRQAAIGADLRLFGACARLIDDE
jgi:hypothetical protein